jgi:hypothetical protein
MLVYAYYVQGFSELLKLQALHLGKLLLNTVFYIPLGEALNEILALTNF